MSSEDPPKKRRGQLAEAGQEEWMGWRGGCVTGLGLMSRWVQGLQGAEESDTGDCSLVLGPGVLGNSGKEAGE